MPPVLIVILVVLGVAVLGVALYYIVRFMRGSIKLTMQRTTFNPGDEITGSFELLVKKPIQGNRLVVSLIGVEVETYYRDGKRHTRSHEVYRDEKIIEDARSYQPGHKAVHQFEITSPDSGQGQMPAQLADNAIAQTVVGVAKATWRQKQRTQMARRGPAGRQGRGPRDLAESDGQPAEQAVARRRRAGPGTRRLRFIRT